jgi:hypothetical protein
MAGTLLAFDEAFPRKDAPTGPILNTPGIQELRANGYPGPHRLLPIAVTSSPETYVTAIAMTAREMGAPNRLILFGHGRVAEKTGIARVTTGIVLGSADLTASNASLLERLNGGFEANAQVELWVCEAAAAGQAGGKSGVLLCQAIADALGVPVLAATAEQQYDSVDQHERPNGGWQSTAQFLPWEGKTLRFAPRPKPKPRPTPKPSPNLMPRPSRAASMCYK